jgi:hypothetical protein
MIIFSYSTNKNMPLNPQETNEHVPNTVQKRTTCQRICCHVYEVQSMQIRQSRNLYEKLVDFVGAMRLGQFHRKLLQIRGSLL